MAFAIQLKRLMNQVGWKAVDLARSTGLSEAAISDYLNGKKEPRGRQSITIAKALNVSLDTLWETAFDPEQTVRREKPPSALKERVLKQLNRMDDEQLKSVLAFINSLSEIEENIKEEKEKQ